MPIRRLVQGQQGVSLVELLLSMSLGALLLLSVERLLPQLWRQAEAIEQRQLLREEVYLLLLNLEKSIRRAGFCQGEGCHGQSLEIKQAGKCLLLRWDNNHNGQWERGSSQHSDYFGYRHRGVALETARGVTDCQSGQWVSLHPPMQVQILDLHFRQRAKQVDIELVAQAGQYKLHRQHRVNREND